MRSVDCDSPFIPALRLMRNRLHIFGLAFGIKMLNPRTCRAGCYTMVSCSWNSAGSLTLFNARGHVVCRMCIWWESIRTLWHSSTAVRTSSSWCPDCVMFFGVGCMFFLMWLPFNDLSLFYLLHAYSWAVSEVASISRKFWTSATSLHFSVRNRPRFSLGEFSYSTPRLYSVTSQILRLVKTSKREANWASTWCSLIWFIAGCWERQMSKYGQV